MKSTLKTLLLLFLMAGAADLPAFRARLTGTIQGQVRDGVTQMTLPGANVIIQGTQFGAATDADGRFIIKHVPVGTYVLRFDFIGYKSLFESSVMVKSQRTTVVNGELQMSTIEMADIEVTAGYFQQEAEQPVSAIQYSNEEIRRAPGSAGDVSRILMSLPSIGVVNDQSNSLIVRGGSPAENIFYVDGIEIPNINHFPIQGTSGGPIGIINVDLISDVTFSAGGFQADYGNRLSSLMDIDFREGSREKCEAQLDFNWAGLGGVIEGPLTSKGSWVVSARRSYLDLVIDWFDVGTSVAPVYDDAQIKLVYDVNPSHQLSLLFIYAKDHSNADQQAGFENDMLYFGDQKMQQYTAGMSWRALWNDHAFSQTSLSFTSTEFDEENYETATGNLLVKNRSTESYLKLRNENRFCLGPQATITAGVEGKYLLTDYDNQYGADSYLSFDETAWKTGLFTTITMKPMPKLSFTAGLRGDYFSLSESMTWAPRVAVNYQLTPRTRINLATGQYYQNLPLILLAQKREHRKLANPKAFQVIAGIEHLLTDNTRLTLEAYSKSYSNFPLDPADPGFFTIDELYYNYGQFTYHDALAAEGEAWARGVEITLQKKLATNIYGLVSGSFFRTRYRAGDGVWRDRIFDNRFLFSAEGGYRHNEKWEFSLRWIYAGGAPYTPFDKTVSREQNYGILDVNNINAVRYPDYHSLNLRVDRRFYFRQRNLVLYASVWNAYNRKNIASYYWNTREQRVLPIYQWGLLPLIGVEYEW